MTAISTDRRSLRPIENSKSSKRLNSTRLLEIQLQWAASDREIRKTCVIPVPSLHSYLIVSSLETGDS